MNTKEFLSDLVINTKYARYLDGRREVWSEIVDRNKQMHLKRFKDHKESPYIEAILNEVYDSVEKKIILPSMRSSQFSGEPIERANHRMYNCCWRCIDGTEAFHEIFYLLLLGVGVGYSVQRHHIDKLPYFKGNSGKRVRFTIEDSIEGWADAVKELVKNSIDGFKTEFDYSKIRPKGTPLKTAGGYAPGHEALKYSLDRVAELLIGKLSPLQAHEVICHLSNAVLSGGNRRSALISIFSMGDDEMMRCKSGEFWKHKEHLCRANNSVYLDRNLSFVDFYDIFKQSVQYGRGEPGFIWTNDLEDGGFNPCVTADSWITTSKGLKQVKDLIDKPFEALVGDKSYSSKGFWKTGTKPVYEVVTSRGYRFKATENHQILTTDGWVEVKDLVLGDTLVVDNSTIKTDADLDDFNKGWLVGEVWGNGCYNPDKYATFLCFWGDTQKERADRACDIVKGFEQDYFSPVKSKNEPSYNKQNKTARVSSRKLDVVVSPYLEECTKNIKDCILEESKSFIKGFISGAFDSDGSVSGNTKGGGIQLQLCQNNKKDLLKIQLMLSLFGIVSTVREMVSRPESLLPDGKGSKKLYKVKPMYRLDIGRDCVEKFYEEIGFTHKEKQEKLKTLIEGKVRTSYKSRYESDVVSITYAGIEDVYDCTVPEADSFVCNGIVVHNCVEIYLSNRGVCNLTTVNMSKVSRWREAYSYARQAAILGTIQASYTDTPYLSNDWKEVADRDALLGVSMTGVFGKRGLFDSEISLQTLAECTADANMEFAGLLGINKAKRVTCIKPEGTTSLVCGTSSGLHPPFAEYYIRRVRVNNNMGIVDAMRRINPDFIEPEAFRPDYESVISVPVHFPEARDVEMDTEIDLIKQFNQWIRGGHREGKNTHNVSYTLQYNEGIDYKEMAKKLYEARFHYGGISIFPKSGGSYLQMPFEKTSKSEYERLVSKFKMINFEEVEEKNTSNDHLRDNVACSGGACELI